jgi:Flp pilus assembly protein TadB
MQSDKQQERLQQNGPTLRPGPPSLLTKVLAVVIGAALLVVGFAVSLVMLAVVLGAGIVIGGIVWWKTRDLRKRLREQAMQAQQMHEQQVRKRAAQRMDSGDVIEDVEFNDETRQK